MTNDYGIKTTRSGYDVSSATLLQQEFNSSYNCLKMMDVAYLTSTASGSRDVVVSHNLGYKPAYLAFFEVGGNGRWYAEGAVEDYSGGLCKILRTVVEDNDITFSLNSADSRTIKVAYRLFADPGE